MLMVASKGNRHLSIDMSSLLHGPAKAVLSAVPAGEVWQDALPATGAGQALCFNWCV